MKLLHIGNKGSSHEPIVGSLRLEGGNGANWRNWDFEVGPTSSGDSYNTHRLRISNNGAEVVTIDEFGQVGIGTPAPVSKLHIHGTGAAPSLTSSTEIFHIGNNVSQGLAIGADPNTPWGMWLQTKRTSNDNTAWPLSLNPLGGNVGIGTIDPQYKLDVEGVIRACEAKVNLENGACPDFVFDVNYDLLTLKSRREIIIKNKHLLHIRAGKEIETNGLALGEFSMGLLQNVEEHELFLYDHDEKINALANENNELKAELGNQQKQIATLQKQIDLLLNKK